MDGRRYREEHGFVTFPTASHVRPAMHCRSPRVTEPQAVASGVRTVDRFRVHLWVRKDSLRFQASSVGRSLTARGSKNGARRSVLPGSAHSPFFEPRAVASVPRTVDRFRPLPSFRNDESAISGTVRRPLATARGSEIESDLRLAKLLSSENICVDLWTQSGGRTTMPEAAS